MPFWQISLSWHAHLKACMRHSVGRVNKNVKKWNGWAYPDRLQAQFSHFPFVAPFFYTPIHQLHKLFRLFKKWICKVNLKATSKLQLPFISVDQPLLSLCGQFLMRFTIICQKCTSQRGKKPLGDWCHCAFATKMQCFVTQRGMPTSGTGLHLCKSTWQWRVLLCKFESAYTILD